MGCGAWKESQASLPTLSHDPGPVPRPGASPIKRNGFQVSVVESEEQRNLHELAPAYKDKVEFLYSWVMEFWQEQEVQVSQVTLMYISESFKAGVGDDRVRSRRADALGTKNCGINMVMLELSALLRLLSLHQQL